jgi:hypothetical protein
VAIQYFHINSQTSVDQRPPWVKMKAAQITPITGKLRAAFVTASAKTTRSMSDADASCVPPWSPILPMFQYFAPLSHRNKPSFAGD